MSMIDVRRVDYVVLSTGILRYPNVSTRLTVRTINVLMI